MIEHRCCDFISFTPVGRAWKVPFVSRIEGGGSSGGRQWRRPNRCSSSAHMSFIEIKWCQHQESNIYIYIYMVLKDNAENIYIYIYRVVSKQTRKKY